MCRNLNLSRANGDLIVCLNQFKTLKKAKNQILKTRLFRIQSKKNLGRDVSAQLQYHRNEVKDGLREHKYEVSKRKRKNLENLKYSRVSGKYHECFPFPLKQESIAIENGILGRCSY